MKFTRQNILLLHRAGIRSARTIARRLGKKTRATQLEVQQILLESGIPTCRSWTKAELERLRKLYPNHSAKRIAHWMKRTVSAIHARANILDIHPATIRGGFKRGRHYNRSTEFKKGLIPWNKGKKGMPSVGRMKETQFKKGHVSRNTLHDGAITIRTDWNGRHGHRRYKWIRLKGKWLMLHVVIWKRHHGPVFPGHIVVFRNGDSMNCAVKNLRCIDRAQHAAETRNKDQYIAKILATTKGFGKGAYDRSLYKTILKQPALIEAKRRQLQLKRSIGGRS